MDLPELRSGLLDADGLEALISDLAAYTNVYEIIVKSGATNHATPEGIDLPAAHDLLLGGAARGVQIRYRYDDADWWDTILRTPEGLRLTRIRHDFAGPQSSS